MATPHSARGIVGTIALLITMATANIASAAEKLVGTYGEERTVLAFKVPDTAAQKLLPEGWQVSPPSTGPSNDANLNVVFVDVLTVQNPDGTPGETVRIAALVVPAKKKGTDAAVPMVVGGFASNPAYVPGAYGNESLASATVDRHVHTDPSGKTNVEESWEFKRQRRRCHRVALAIRSRGSCQEQGRGDAAFGGQARVLPDLPDRAGSGRGAQHCNQHRPRAEICVQRHWSEVGPAV
jgi:hypothetical protein